VCCISMSNNVVYVDEWLAKSGKKKNQMESLPARQLRNATKAREDSPNYGTALDEQNARRNMSIFRSDSLKVL
jgi:hypothetical protein